MEIGRLLVPNLGKLAQRSLGSDTLQLSGLSFVLDVVISMRALLVIFGLGILAAAFAGQGRPDVPFQIIDRGPYSGETEAGVKVLRTERAFEEFLKDKGEEKIKPLMKQVDWQSEQIVVIFAGQHPSGGYGIDIRRIANIDIQRLQVEAKVTKPAPGQIVTQALTTPYVILKMQRQVAAIKLKFLTD